MGNYKVLSEEIDLVEVHTILHFSDPSSKNGAQFKSCKSSNEIYCQESSNDETTYTTENIKEQLHYDAWRKVESIYRNLKELEKIYASLQEKFAS